MKPVLLLIAADLAFSPAILQAVPPFVTDDVVPAEHQTFEWYLGYQYEREGDSINRQTPTTELAYGLTERLELSVEMAWISTNGAHGMGDIDPGLKYMFLKESDSQPGMSFNYEQIIPTSSASRGLGSGAFDEEITMQIQKTWGWFTTYASVGCTLTGTPHVNGVAESRNNIWFAGCAQEYKLSEKVKLLSEIYLETSDTPGEPNQFAGGVGMEYEFSENFKLQGIIERSLRDGPADFRAYVGFEWDFDAPWKKDKGKE